MPNIELEISVGINAFGTENLHDSPAREPTGAECHVYGQRTGGDGLHFHPLGGPERHHGRLSILLPDVGDGYFEFFFHPLLGCLGIFQRYAGHNPESVDAVTGKDLTSSLKGP